jgi:hypothetical protein
MEDCCIVGGREVTFLALYLVREVIPWLRDFFVVK